jgi:hypothetical protein
MEEMMEQATKMMESMWGPWRKMMAEPPWLKQPNAPFMSTWKPWISTMRSTYETNMSAWNTFMERGEEAFFKMFKEAPFYNEALDDRIREIWDGIAKAQKTQQDVVAQGLTKMEEMLRETEESMS